MRTHKFFFRLELRMELLGLLTTDSKCFVNWLADSGMNEVSKRRNRGKRPWFEKMKCIIMKVAICRVARFQFPRMMGTTWFPLAEIGPARIS